jgi:hypothetical protein
MTASGHRGRRATRVLSICGARLPSLIFRTSSRQSSVSVWQWQLQIWLPFEADWQRQWLVERGIEIISVAGRHLPHDVKSRHAAVPCPRVAAIGNVLRHGYHTIAAPISGHSLTVNWHLWSELAGWSWRRCYKRMIQAGYEADICKTSSSEMIFALGNLIILDLCTGYKRPAYWLLCTLGNLCNSFNIELNISYRLLLEVVPQGDCACVSC